MQKSVALLSFVIGGVACQGSDAEAPSPMTSGDDPSSTATPRGRGGADGGTAPAQGGSGGATEPADAGAPPPIADAAVDRTTSLRPDALPAVAGDAGDGGLPSARSRSLTGVLAWDGDTTRTGSGWGKPIQGGTARVSLSTAQPSPSGKVPNRSWLFDVQSSGPTESGWNWSRAVPIAKARYLGFWVKVVGPTPARDFVVSLRDAVSGHYSIDPRTGFLGPSIRKFKPTFADGNWNEVLIPVADVFGALPRYDSVVEMCIRGSTPNGDFRIFIDEISFYE